MCYRKAMTVSERALKASFEVSYLVARALKPHSIVETLILPAAVAIVKMICGEGEAQKLRSIPFSHNTVKRRIDEIANDQESMLTQQL